MNRSTTVQLALGFVLILLGIWFFAARQFPQLRELIIPQLDWPLYVVAAGAVILLVGLFTRAPAMAIPACIVAGVGGILYYQNRFADWDSWSFLWTLVPGFVGVGRILTGVLGQDRRDNFRQGFNLVVISAILLLVFAAIMQRLDFLGPYGPPVLLVLLGVYFIGRGLIRRARGPARDNGQG